MKRWKEIGVDKLSSEAEGLFKSLIAQYGAVKLKDSFPESVAELGKQELYELRNLQIGNVAPQLEARDIAGNSVSLTGLRGKVVVLDFGSHSRCSICVALYPELRDLAERYKDRPFLN